MKVALSTRRVACGQTNVSMANLEEQTSSFSGENITP